MKPDKICISKTIGFFSIGCLILIAFVSFTLYLGKTKTISNTRAEVPQCIYPKGCNDTCEGVCTESGCSNNMYKCMPYEKASITSPTIPETMEETCVPYGTKLYTTSDGECWSLSSAQIKYYTPPGMSDQIGCVNEIVKKTDTMLFAKCPARSYCNDRKNFIPPLGTTRRGMEYVSDYSSVFSKSIGDRYDRYGNRQGSIAACTEYSYNSYVSARSGPGCIEKFNVPAVQCTDEYVCTGEYKMIDSQCWYLGNRKCSPKNKDNDAHVCCSDIVDNKRICNDKTSVEF